MSSIQRAFALLLFLLPFAAWAQPDENAQELFAKYHESIYQIRVIDNAANNKSSTGTGFLVSDDGLIATNYHVIASTLDVPDKYRIEVLGKDDKVIKASLVNVDIVNDLALLRIEPTGAPALTLASAAPPKGDTVFSIGFPYDLGITVVPGTYNGLAPHSVNSRVHFTGSLNPGMSGGPAFNPAGQVIGVNESTAGNQLSFLVPIAKLTALLKAPVPDSKAGFEKLLVAQLKANSKRMIDELLAGDWSTVPLGGAHALDEVTPFLRCWGQSKDQSDKTDKTPFWAQRSCQTDHNIYISHNHTTGKIELQFYWIQGDDMDSVRFYSYYRRIFENYRPGNYGGEQDLGNWACDEDFVKTSGDKGELTKAVFCTRAYKELKGIYDVLFLQGSVDRDNEAHMIHFTIAGTTKQLALEFTKKFMDAGVW